MSNPQGKTQVKESAHVESIVQEYMDSLLVDLFPDVQEELSPDSNIATQNTSVEPEIAPHVPTELPQTDESTEEQTAIQAKAIEQPLNEKADESLGNVAPVEVEPLTVAAPSEALPELTPPPETPADIQAQAETEVSSQTKANPVELKYPKAPPWAQESFDVLLFDVCGLKLAVPMESLGKIIKVDHETNHLIGRPGWFIGSYNDNEQNLFVVDTAQYIMPEKGFDLHRDGFEFIIQLQRSKWTLACKKVHSTVRIEPDQVKWRSQQGKRQWLSGTVIDHMCALIHVDSLISLLEAEAS